ncbi:MAG TPA: FAD-dependent hydroxylase [Oculatellaceae cyanobacterium]|jgi:2-octaprenyl-6-methoxyphenol hydroxylase
MALSQLNNTVSTPQPTAPELSFDYDLAIVGGGIVGATLAAALKNSGLKVALIESQLHSAAVAKGRAYAISLLSGRIFEGIGIWQKILPQITTFNQVQISDADYAGVVHFQPQDVGTDGVGYAAEHRVLLTALQDYLKDCPNVSWLCPAEVISAEYQADGVELEVMQKGKGDITPPYPPEIQGGVEGKFKIRTRLLVAADGARSPIRNAASITTQGWAYWQSCVVATIKLEKPHNNIAYERFWHTGPMGVLPLPGNRCQVVWTNPHAEAKALQELDKAEFLAKLEEYTGGLLGRLELISDRFIFPVQLMQSDRYTIPRLALIGDAAHCCHPVAGQGMNLGIRDAAALAQVLTDAHQQQEDIGSLTVLERYESWRKHENTTILAFTDFLNRMFSNNWLPLVVVRRLGLWMLQHIHPIKTYALQLMTGLRGRPPKLASR